jgi:hypothetical protein
MAKNTGLSFDFVGDEALRTSLEQDGEELAIAVDHGANKAVVVLAGSMIEAVLLDHLVSTDHMQRTGTDPTKLEFSKLINTCNAEGVVSDRTVHLLHAVRDYRNLIHPGRSLRLNDRVSVEAAVIARSVVGLICAEIADRPNQAFGMTAEQVLAKIRKDSHSIHMVDRLLSTMRKSELDRLLLKVVPNAIFETDDLGDDLSLLSALSEATYQKVEVETRKKLLSDLCQTIRRETGDRVRRFLSYMFRGWYLVVAEEDQVALILDRILIETRSQGRTLTSWPYFRLLNGLPTKTAMEVVGNLYHRVVDWSDEEAKEMAYRLLEDPDFFHFYASVGPEGKERFATTLSELKKREERYRLHPHSAGLAEWVKHIIDGAEVPF